MANVKPKKIKYPLTTDGASYVWCTLAPERGEIGTPRRLKDHTYLFTEKPFQKFQMTLLLELKTRWQKCTGTSKSMVV